MNNKSIPETVALAPGPLHDGKAASDCHDPLPGPLTLFPAHSLPQSPSPNASSKPPTIEHPPQPPRPLMLPLTPLEPSPTVPDPVVHLQLTTLTHLTSSGASQQPRSDLHSQLIPSEYHCSPPLNHN
ncbi:hypothetical protein E4T56_gene9294 [Termitomyces sp. T112]|nr:hypothetical protein E4T56_gene9294 [Termitomyces sp. T112]